MLITKEALDKREQALRSDLEAINGALQELAFWRGFLDYDLPVGEEPSDEDVPTLQQVVENLLGPTAEALEVVDLRDPGEEVV